MMYTAAFTLLSVFVTSFRQSFIQTPLSSFRFVPLGLKRCLLLNCIQGGSTPCWSNRSIPGCYIRSCEIKRLLDNKNICRQLFLLSMLSIMSTNRCSHTTRLVSNQSIVIFRQASRTQKPTIALFKRHYGPGRTGRCSPTCTLGPWASKWYSVIGNLPSFSKLPHGG